MIGVLPEISLYTSTARYASDSRVSNSSPMRKRNSSAAFGSCRKLRLALQDRQQLFPVLRRLVQRVEPRDRGRVLRIDLDDALVRLDRLVDLAELALVDRADLGVERLLLIGVVEDVGLARVRRQQRLPAPQAQQQRDQLVERLDVVGLDLQRLLVDLDRLVRPIEHVFVELAGAEVVLLLRGGVSSIAALVRYTPASSS